MQPATEQAKSVKKTVTTRLVEAGMPLLKSKLRAAKKYRGLRFCGWATVCQPRAHPGHGLRERMPSLPETSAN